MFVSLLVCSFVWAMCEARQGVWSSGAPSASNYTLFSTLSAPTTNIRCVAACLITDGCAASAFRAPYCDLWAPTLGPSDGPARLYRLESCVHRMDPCAKGPCHPDATCRNNTRGPDCFQRPFQCLCPGNREGPLCERCVANRTGPNCNVDVSESVLADGWFFFLPAGLDVDGKDVDGEKRPNCSESRLRCSARGMRLLSVDSAAKNETLAKLQLHLHSCLLCFYRLDLGRNDTSSAVWWWGAEAEGRYLNSSGFKGWYYGQPDNAPGETAAAFSPNNHYAWADVSCTFPAYYICEYDARGDH